MTMPVADSSIESESSTMTSSHHASASTSAGILTGSLTDFRHAFRLLWKSKRITATTLVTLALCIGATTAIFSSVYSLMLKPLPYQEPERIVELYSSAVKAGLNHMPANVPFYLDYSTERDLLREPRAVDVLLRPGRRKGFCRPYPRRTDDRRDLQHPADTTRDRHLLHEGAEQTGRRQGRRAHAVLLADAVSGKSGGPRQGGADRR